MKSNTESKDTFRDPIILKMLEQPTLLKQTINLEMPFGKYKDTKLLNLPEPYLVWFHQQGFPKGKLGEQLALIYEIKLNGLEAILKPLIDKKEV